MESSPTTVTQNYKVPSTSKISVDKLLRVGCYDLEKTIGKGNFAIVKLASHIVTKTKVAIKIIDKTCLNDEYLAKTYREISILKTLRHRHITRLYEVMQSETMIYLVTEYAPNGEIFDHLVENGRMKEPEAARVFTQLVLAVQYCHSKGVVHRDLKAENVLLDKDMNIKLADFGFSNHYEDGSPLTTWCGSPPYAAPEVFQGLEYDGPKADIWSLGVVLYALVCGALPFDGKTLLELKSRVVTGKFRIPYFMSQDCEHLIRNMLVVEPDRRYNLKQIIKHRWLSEWIEEIEYECQQATKIFASYSSLVVHSQNASGLISDCSMPLTTSIPNLDSVVVSHMLQLSGLTADKIAQSVHEDRFDNIYAIYYLLYDKLQHRRRQHQKIQQHANRVRSRTSITTGVVDRSEPVHQETIDRLSPLCGTSSTLIEAQDQWMDYPVDLEKFSDIELECLQGHSENAGQTQLCSNQSYSGGNNSTRRHTVGPGDVAHEQALQDQNVVPLNFKCEPSKTQQQTYPYPPINLPMLQNQPLHYLTIKDQHLLKPPLAMGATGSFNRRASDGGANLPYSFTSVQQSLSIETHRAQNDPYYISPNTKLNNEIMAANVNKHNLPETPNQCLNPEDASEEIERYMQVRGCSKRHTVGCTDDLSHNPVDQQRFNQPNSHIATQTATTGVVPASNQGAPSGMRTRRTGLLTVTERPPVICPELIREVESRMNRDYFPPALKLQQNSNAGFSQSPPQAASATYGSVNNATFSSSYPLVSATAIGGTAAMSLNTTASANSAAGVSYSNRRIYGKASKLPPVQEVGRYSPVRRASEGSKVQFQGPLQECQYLQKGIAQRHFLAAPSPPLQENSVSLPGSPIHGKNAFGNTIFRRTGLPALSSTAAQDLEIPTEVVKKIIPRLEQLVKEQCVSIDVANKIMNSGRVPMDLAKHLGLEAHCGISDNIGYQMHQQQSYSSSVSPLSTPNSAASSNVQMNTLPDGGGYFIAASGPIPQQPAFVVGSQSRNSSRCQSPLYASLASSLHSSNASEASSVTFGVASGGESASCCGGSSPLHQITKGISYLTTIGGGSITRGTSAASEMATAATQPLDLSMDVCTFEESETPRGSVTPKNWFLPPSTYYDLKPLNLSPAHTVRAVTTPPASPNLCIIQEENANMQTANAINNEVAYADCNSGASYLGAAYTGEDAIPAGQHPMHPQICLTDVQGSEITLVALSTEKSHEDESDSVAQHVMPLMSLKGLIITEPSNDMPSITRGIGRKPSLETDQTVQPVAQTQQFNDRRGSDKSLGFSDDSLSNDSNNLSPCQEPSASSGFKSDSHSEIGDPTEGHTTPDSMCDSRRMSEEMCYEVPLSHECSNLDPTRILEMVKQTIDLTMPPGGFILQKASNTTTVPSITASPAGNALRNDSSSVNDSSGNSDVSFFYSTDLYSSTTSTNLSLEYSGGLQIEVQVCEGRGRDNKTGKGIKLRRISGDQFEYGKLCQHLISQLSLQQVGA